MNLPKNTRVDRAMGAMRDAFNAASDRVDFGSDAWLEGVMDDVRRQTFEEQVDFRVLKRAAWGALAASFIVAMCVYYFDVNKADSNNYLNDVYSWNQPVLEVAYGN